LFCAGRSGFHAASHGGIGDFFFRLNQNCVRRLSRKFHSSATLTPHTLGQWEDVGGEKAAHGDSAMTLQNAICKASPSGRRVRLPSCPQCADTLLAPLLAEHVSASLVHNHWVCESCGHTFRKAHEFEAFEDAAA
jgi:hypothetical protein